MKTTEIVGTMDQRTKLIFALMQIENISNLMKDNEYEKFFVSHLIPMKCELQRQYDVLTGNNKYTKIEE